MAKFSAGIEDEGPSNRTTKRQRVEQILGIEGSGQEGSEQEEEDEESEGEEPSEESEGEEEEEEESEESGAEQGAMMNPQTTTRDGSISITLTDPEVLDCFICYEALTIPVFQCENGHIACSICCFKIRNKCPSCASPIGYNRCRAIEKVLESVKVSCQNAKYGCREIFSYSMKQRHEKSCTFAPCSCPNPGCNFEGSSKQLCGHLVNEHKHYAKLFQYDRLVSITLLVSDKFLILREETDGSLFIINNKVETLGNVVTLNQIWPSAERCIFYELIAKAQAEGSTIRLQSFIKSMPKRVDSPLSLGFLLIPSQFIRVSPLLKMELRLWHPGHFPNDFQRPSST